MCSRLQHVALVLQLLSPNLLSDCNLSCVHLLVLPAISLACSCPPDNTLLMLVLQYGSGAMYQ